MSFYLQGISIAAGVVAVTTKPVRTALSAAVKGIASCAFALQHRCCKRPSLQKQFSLKTLPDFERNEEEWKRETGLTLNECRQIDQYIQKQMKRWNNCCLCRCASPIRIPKEESRLPRTLIIYHEDGHLCVQVCCKKKGNLGEVGTGSFKKVKRSVEWLSKSLWAQSTFRQNRKLSRYHKLLDGIEGFAPFPKGLIHYENKTTGPSKKTACFSPLREGDWYSFNQQYKNGPIYRANLPSFANQMFKILLSLEENKLVHDDLRDANILYYYDGEDLKIEATDFDYARHSDEKQTNDGPAVGKDRIVLIESLGSINYYYRLPQAFRQFMSTIPSKKISESFSEFTSRWLPLILKAPLIPR